MPLNVLQSCKPALYWSIGRLYNQLDNPNEILQESVKDILTFHFGQVIKEIVKGKEWTHISLGYPFRKGKPNMQILSTKDGLKFETVERV